MLLPVLLSGCFSTNTKEVALPLTPADIQEIREMAEDRRGVIHWNGRESGSVSAEVRSISPDSLLYAPNESTQLLWSSLGDVSRVEFPSSRTRAAAWGGVGGAAGGALVALGLAALFSLACDDDGLICGGEVDWGSVALSGAVYGGLAGLVLGLLGNELDPPAFEFGPGP